ncbi:Signal peptide peptidase-like 3 [Paramecium bursaria]
MLIILVLQMTANSQYILTTIVDNKPLQVVSQPVIDKQFIFLPQQQCYPSCMLVEDQSILSREFILYNTGTTSLNIFFNPTSLNKRAFTIKDEQNLIDSSEIPIIQGGQHTFQIVYECITDWGYVEIHIRVNNSDQIQKLTYIKLCKQLKYQNSHIILLAIALILVIVGSFYGSFTKKHQIVDEIESRETFYRVRQMSKYSISKQYQRSQTFDDEQETLNTQIIVNQQKLQQKAYYIISLLTCATFFYIYRPNIINYPLYYCYFLSSQKLMNDFLKFIISSYSPSFTVPLFQKIETAHIITYLITSIIFYYFMIKPNWIIQNIFNISIALVIIKVPQFNSLKTIIIVYTSYFIIIYGSLYMEFQLPQLRIGFPNTLFLDNPKLTCEYINLAQVILPAKLLSYTISFQNSLKQGKLLFVTGLLGYILSLGLRGDPLSIQEELISIGIPLLFIIIIEQTQRNLQSFWYGIAIDHSQIRIKADRSYELTIENHIVKEI